MCGSKLLLQLLWIVLLGVVDHRLELAGDLLQIDATQGLRCDYLLANLGCGGGVEGSASADEDPLQQLQPLRRPDIGLSVVEVGQLTEDLVSILLGAVKLDPLFDCIAVLWSNGAVP